MKIAIDGADLDHQRIDGTRVYIKNLLDWFGRIDEEDEFLIYHQKNFNSLLRPKFYDNYQERKIPYKFWWTQTRLAFELKRDQPDVLWMPIQQLPYLAKKDRFKKVVTIHDLAFKIFPQYFIQSDRFKLNLFTDYAIKNADQIIAVSQSTKNDILRFYPKINSEKIEVIYHGVDKTKNEKLKTKNNDSKLKILTKNYQLKTTNYLLYLGAIQPRKDLITLVEAFELLKTREKSNLKLVIAGEPAWRAKSTLEKIKNSKYSQDIILTEQVSFEEAAELYKQAEIFILPSLYEGFGMPILEAWAAGTSVIVADNSSLKEIGGEAVEKFQTGQAKDLASKIRLLLKDKNRKIELIKKGQERLKNFSWEKCARETLNFFKTHLVAGQ